MHSPRKMAPVALRTGLCVLLTLLGTVLGLASHASAPAAYSSTATFYVGVSDVSNVTDLSTGQAYVLNQMPSFASVATSPLVLNNVVKTLKLDIPADKLADKVETGTTTTSTVMTLTVADSDAERAAAIANETAKQFNVSLQELTRHQTGDKVRVEATLLTPAVAAAIPSTTPGWQVGVLGGLGGLAVAIIILVAEPRIARTRQLLRRGDEDVASR